MADIKTSSTLKNSLISYWDMEEAGGNREDSYTNDYELEDNNSVGSGAMTGVGNGVGADFERSYDEWLGTDGDKANLNITGDISISFWADFDDNASQLVAKKNDGTNGYVFELGGSGPLKIMIEDNNAKSEAYTDSAAGTSLAHWVVTCDPTGGPDTKFYKNGSLADSTQNTTAASAIGASSTAFVMSQTGGEGLDGLMKFFGIWERELTSSEVTELYNDGKGLPYEETIVGPANLKTLDTVSKANIKTINSVAIANVKSIDTVT